jgi:hypothetical protein
LARALLGNCAGKIEVAKLAIDLDRLMPYDSVVRDICTAGHLCKLLGRNEVFQRTSNYRIIGMPNKLFDELSQRERTMYFERYPYLELDGEVYELDDVRMMLNREAVIFANFLK